MAAALALAFAVPALAQDAPRPPANPVAVAGVPADVFVGYDVFRGASLSPSGKYIAGIRREAVGDVLVVIDWESKKVTPIQYARADQLMQLNSVTWKSDNRLVFSLSQRIRIAAGSNSARRQRGSGRDDFGSVGRVYASNADGSNTVTLFEPGAGTDLPRTVSPGVADILENDPDHVLLITPNFGGTELRKVNLTTGRNEVVEEGGQSTFAFVTDITGRAVLRQDGVAGGRGFAWKRRGPGQSEWKEIVRYRGASGANSGTTFSGLFGTDKPGEVFVLARPPGKDTTGLYRYNTATGEFTGEVKHVDGFDITDEFTPAALVQPKTRAVLAACWWGQRFICEWTDPALQRTYRGLQNFIGKDNNLIITDMNDDKTRWLIYSRGPQELGTYYVYDTTTRAADVLAVQRPTVEASALPTSRVVEYTTRDGVKLWGYLWIPPGAENAKNLPLIMHPHGGPEGRDLWGIAAGGWPQYWAANGYLVFQPNFRGGGGSGRAFVEAGWRQWGQRMQQDVRDAADHLIKEGYADRNRVCIAGWSYGGYATMTGAMTDGDLYKCASAGAGVSDLLDMLNWERVGDGDVAGSGTQSVSYKYWSTAIGDANSDRDMLIRYSAARNADKINIPMQLIHGDDDEIVPFSQSAKMRDALQRLGKPVELITLKDVGHSPLPLQAEEDRVILLETLAFFQKHLGMGWKAPTAPSTAPPAQ
jgi:dipeptidyl aminopeptidase/acylaminoacyl peptidase